MSTYTIRTEDGLTMVALTDRPEYQTIFALLEELDAQAVWALPERLNVLIDETDAGPSLISAGHVRSWVTRWRAASALKQCRIAVVAPSLPMFALNRMAQGIAGDEAEGHLEVFRNHENAVSWLLSDGHNN
jgi:hypothetical protein